MIHHLLCSNLNFEPGFAFGPHTTLSRSRNRPAQGELYNRKFRLQTDLLAQPSDCSLQSLTPQETIGATTIAASPFIFERTSERTQRSSNLRLAKQFSERDRDGFKLESFDFIARFFENSLGELQARNADIESTYRRVDANRFTAVIYKAGKSIARCTVFIGGRHFADGIAYSATETNDSNSFNECLTVKSDDQSLYLQGMGMAHLSGSRDTKLSQEGAAELFWSMLIEPLQRRRHIRMPENRMPPPGFDQHFCLGETVEDFAIEQFVAKRPVEAFIISILPW